MSQISRRRSKLTWIRILNGIGWRLKRIKRGIYRTRERLSSYVYFIRTGTSKKEDHIQQYADENDVVPNIHPNDHIFRFLIEDANLPTVDRAINFYFYNGADSAKKLSNLLFSQLGLKRTADTSLLEFASGYGCVTRHLIKELAPINIVSCDIHQAACSFIESAIGVKTILSASTPENLDIENGSFDAVFALSFFSHMPDQTWGRWLKSLFDKVKPCGYLIFTTQGMTSRKFFGNPIIPSSGIWFTPSSEQKDLDVAEYGNTIVSSEYVNNTIMNVLHENIFSVTEAAWWSHQDLYVVKKTQYVT